jgi:hypothetical protein
LTKISEQKVISDNYQKELDDIENEIFTEDIIQIQNNIISLKDPVSVAPGPQGLGLMQSMFTADPKDPARLNINNVTIFALTDESVKAKYIEATTGLVVPDKKLILG